MRQVHVINESFGHYHSRKYGLANGLIIGGIVFLMFGYIIFDMNRYYNEVGWGLITSLFVSGILLIFIGYKLRKGVKQRDYSP